MASRHDSESGALLDEEQGNTELVYTAPSRRHVWMLALGAVGVLLVATVLIGVALFWDKLSGDGSPAVNPNVALTFTFPRAAVASDNANCSQIGANIMSKGGNAADAAVSVALCLGVLQQFASGSGGGGIAIVYLPNGTATQVDFREVAPANASKNMFVDSADPTADSVGGLSIAVPGEIAGLEYLYKNFGSGNVAWADLFQPAIELAKSSIVSPLLAQRIQENKQYILQFPGLESVFAPGGTLLQEGDTLLQPALANTLATIAAKGAVEYYTGSIAVNITNDVAAVGGIVTMDDMAWFWENGVRVSEPLSTFFQGFEIIGAAPPFGGVCNALALNLLEAFNLPLMGATSDLAQHWIVEAFKFAFSDRMAEGDPQFNAMDEVVAAMTSKKHASYLRQRFNASTTFPFENYLDLVGGPPVDDKGTSHFSVIDPNGMAIALTTTVNTAFGSKILSPSTGIVLNDEMADFSSPNATNVFGLPPTDANFIVPYKKPLSSMSPTVVLQDDELYMVVGGSGGPTIITAVMQVLLGVLAYNEPIGEAITNPRLHNQFTNETRVESNYLPAWINSLKSKHHNINLLPPETLLASVQGIVRTSNGLEAASDWRKKGLPAGF